MAEVVGSIPIAPTKIVVGGSFAIRRQQLVHKDLRPRSINLRLNPLYLIDPPDRIPGRNHTRAFIAPPESRRPATSRNVDIGSRYRASTRRGCPLRAPCPDP